MICKKMYIVMAIFLAISGSILTWILLYGDLPPNTPVRAKQVLIMGDKANSRSNFFTKYNTLNNVQTMGEVKSFY